ncbi:MAG: class I SAM-dependent methyltransferase [Pseudomonadales bacterium]|nr:class I SAM-dependent methyltransferase [Pseudomonadales bacterium]
MLALGRYKIILSKSPLDAYLHYSFAKNAARLGLYNLANAELKNAIYLGLDDSKSLQLSEMVRSKLDDRTKMDVNQYQRFRVLQSHLEPLLVSGGSVLDIGGGHGLLSQFVPNNSYFLIEPSVNGISGLELPFPDNSFDVVVICHVLEHIPENDRGVFLDELARVAKRNVLIFNPFRNPELDENERLQLILDVTGATWAKEHLDCGLPEVENVCDYISSKGLPYQVKGYGDIYASTAALLMSYFAVKSRTSSLEKINQHLNERYDQLLCSQYPTNIMIDVDVR